MIILTIAVFIVGLAVFTWGIFGWNALKAEIKTEPGKTQIKKGMQPLSLICSGIGIIVVSMIIIGSMGSDSAISNNMRQRLNEPVISEAQLYGYEIVGKHMEEHGSPDDTSYFIDIRDTLTNKKILKQIKASEELFERIEIGNSFGCSLMGKLNEPGLEAPAPASEGL